MYVLNQLFHESFLKFRVDSYYDIKLEQQEK